MKTQSMITGEEMTGLFSYFFSSFLFYSFSLSLTPFLTSSISPFYFAILYHFSSPSPLPLFFFFPYHFFAYFISFHFTISYPQITILRNTKSQSKTDQRPPPPVLFRLNSSALPGLPILP